MNPFLKYMNWKLILAVLCNLVIKCCKWSFAFVFWFFLPQSLNNFISCGLSLITSSYELTYTSITHKLGGIMKGLLERSWRLSGSKYESEPWIE